MSKLNKVNILKLAKFLETLPQEKFHMLNYKLDKRGNILSVNEYSCGTIGCALGWAPTALGNTCTHYKSWEEYNELNLGITTSADWDWCFSGDWVYIDNTPKGAALRLVYLVNNGVPDNYLEQMNEDNLEHDYMFEGVVNG